ncbi:MAG TPA: ArpU family phage packaging/lysis transcriptional regulator, partial [Savagea sp.]
MEQLTLLPEIDEKATKKAVERVLEKYRIYKLQVSLDRLPTITADYSFMPRSYTGTTSDSTA